MPLNWGHWQDLLPAGNPTWEKNLETSLSLSPCFWKENHLYDWVHILSMFDYQMLHQLNREPQIRKTCSYLLKININNFHYETTSVLPPSPPYLTPGSQLPACKVSGPIAPVPCHGVAHRRRHQIRLFRALLPCEVQDGLGHVLQVPGLEARPEITTREMASSKEEKQKNKLDWIGMSWLDCVSSHSWMCVWFLIVRSFHLIILFHPF